MCNYDIYEPEIITYEQLLEIVKEQQNHMTPDEKYARYCIYIDPTFEEYVLSHMKPGEKVNFCSETHFFEVIKEENNIIREK